MFKYFRHLIGQFVTKDSRLSAKHPLLYPAVKMTILFIMIQLFVQVMYQISETESEFIREESFHPPNNHTSLFPVDHTPLLVINNGSLKTLYQLLSKSDVTMVMLYAPWCYHSAQLAQTIVKVARTQNEVSFIAINCWTGDCRRSEGASMYPRLLIYHKHLTGRIEYFGDKSYHSLLSYSWKLIRPLNYLSGAEEFYNLLNSKELLIVGYFNFSDNVIPFRYKEYYYASLLGLKTDYSSSSFPAQYMTIITSNNINISDLPRPPSISVIVKHRGITEVLSSINLSSSEIHQWIKNCTNQYKIVNEFIPAGDITRLVTTPISLLFLPLSSSTGDSNVIKTLSQYITAATHTRQSVDHHCTSLNHLSHISCPDPAHLHQSLPLCNTSPSSFCPKYNPLLPNRHIPYYKALFCQDDKVGVVTGGWPPPCTHVRTSFYYVDSNKYWSLAQSMGVANSTMSKQFLIFIDFKNQFQFINYFDEDITTHHTFNEIFQRVVTGQATPLYRSGCGQGKCLLSEISSNQLHSIIMPHPPIKTESAVLLVHYVGWCVACTNLWPSLHSINNHYDNHTHLSILRINGDYNDIPKCHTPHYYPSIALYNRSSMLPVWFPENMTMSVENIMEFIETHLQLVSHDIDTDGLKEAREWEGMGWRLWEIAEKNRQLMEERNIDLGREITSLRERISLMEDRQENCNNDHGGNDHLQSLINQLNNIVNYQNKPTNINSDRSGSDDDNNE